MTEHNFYFYVAIILLLCWLNFVVMLAENMKIYFVMTKHNHCYMLIVHIFYVIVIVYGVVFVLIRYESKRKGILLDICVQVEEKKKKKRTQGGAQPLLEEEGALTL